MKAPRSGERGYTEIDAIPHSPPIVPPERSKAKLMTTPVSAEQLCSTRCVPCEGGVPKMSHDESVSQLTALAGWELLSGPDRIRKSWTVKHFIAGLEFFQKVAEVAEAEGHHPDLHLVGYRNVSIEIWTHAIQGLSLNDFILAARIDQLPIQLRKS